MAHPYFEMKLPPIRKRPIHVTRLHYWLLENGVSKYAVARGIGCDEAMVRFWANGQSIPDLVYAYMLEEFTDGGVPVSSWLAAKPGKELWNRRKQFANG